VLLRNLGSGSRGNATVVAHRGRAILIDAALPRRRMRAGIEGLGLEGVLITHRHTDHLGPYAAELGAPVWIGRDNLEDARWLGRIGDGVRIFDGRPFRIGPFRVAAFPLPHPGDESWHSWGFLIEGGRRRLFYATDLGHVPDGAAEALRDAHAILLESNHDPAMERASARPPSLVRWVLSDHGHLSNDQCAGALARARRPHTVVLGHLSEDCNTPPLALRTARRALPRSTRLLAARQDAPTETIRI